MINKFNIAPPLNVFNYKGIPYNGLIHVRDGQAYSGGEPSNNAFPLSSNNNIEGELILSPFYKDRSLSNEINLPYSFENIILESSFLMADIWNRSIDILHDNFLFLYSRSFMVDARKTLEILDNRTYDLDPDYKYTFISSFLTDINNVIIMAVKEKLDDGTTFIECLSSNSNFTSYTQVFNLSSIKPGSELSFKKISGFFVNDKSMFIVDEIEGNVYKYDIDRYKAEISDTTLVLERQISTITPNRSNKIISIGKPTSIFGNDDYIMIFDDESKQLQVYDVNLSFLKSIRNPLFAKCKAITGSYNKATRQYFFISQYIEKESNINTTKTILFVYDNLFSFIRSYSVEELNIYEGIGEQDTLKAVLFPSLYNNWGYFVTGRSIFKKIVTNLSGFHGEYKSEDQWSIDSAGILPISSKNYILLCCDDHKLRWTVDQNKEVSVLRQTSFNIFKREQLYIKPAEYMQAFTYNKSLFKIIYNHYELLKRIVYKFKIVYPPNARERLDGITYILDDDYSNIDYIPSLNFFIGDNEILNIDIINRTWLSIYNLQCKIALLLNVDTKNRYMDNNSFDLTNIN